MLEDYARRNGFPRPTHFTDDGISGTRFDRPGFMAMMAEVEAGNVGAIIVKDMSRLGRDYLKVGQVMETLRQKNVRLIALIDGVDSFRGDDDFTPFRNITNEWYARDIIKKIRSTFQAKGKAGRHLTGTVIYGYLWDESRRHWLVDEEAAAVVRRIFAMSMDGYGPSQIARRLSAEIVEIPSIHLARYGEGVNKNKAVKDPYAWGSSVIVSILKKREYNAEEVSRIMADHGISCGGVCGMFSADNDLSSNRHIQRQAAIDYIRREAAFTAEVGGKYMLVCPAAVGRPGKYDDSETDRSIDALSRIADVFVEHGIRAAIEPIRAAETSIVHTFAEARDYIRRLNHPGVQHINGDVYHMLVGESHIGQAIRDAGSMLTNLHMADTNRCALGDGSLDIDTIIMALYLIGYNQCPSCFVTPEPLGPGGDPYPAQNAKTDSAILDKLVFDSVNYFRAREEELLG